MYIQDLNQIYQRLKPNKNVQLRCKPLTYLHNQDLNQMLKKKIKNSKDLNLMMKCIKDSNQS